MGTLSGKSIIVTGAANGIGEAAARLFCAQGARLTIVDVDATAGEVLANELSDTGGEVQFRVADVSVEDDVAAMVAAALERFGRLDGAFNNAGVGHAAKRLHDVSLAEWNRTISVNLLGVFLCMKHEIAAMLGRGGSIVNTGSVGSLTTIKSVSCPEYIAAKHGVLGLTRSAAFDYGADGIRVNALLPGATKTPLVQRLQARRTEEQRQRANRSLLGRMAEPSEIAEGALWLLSDASSYVTGTNLSVDGGYTLA